MARSARSLRALYLFRVAFSVVWVTLVFSLASPRASAGSSSVLAGILLVIYPVSDSVATVFDLRVNSAWKVWHYANLARSGPGRMIMWVGISRGGLGRRPRPGGRACASAGG